MSVILLKLGKVAPGDYLDTIGYPNILVKPPDFPPKRLRLVGRVACEDALKMFSVVE